MVQSSSRRRASALVLGLTAWLVCASCDKGGQGTAAASDKPQNNQVATSEEPEVMPTNQVEGEAFLVQWKPVEAAPGTTTTGNVVLTPKPPFKCNLEYPYKLKVSGAGVELAKTELTKPDMVVDVKQVIIPVVYKVPAEPQIMDGHLAFSVCTDDKCLIERKPFRMTTKPQ